MANHILEVGEAPSVNPTAAVGNDYENIQSNPDAFGASVARAENAQGQALVGAGTTGLDILTARQDLQDEIHASEVNTDLASKITDKYSEFGKLQGRAAQDALPQFKSDIDSLSKQAIGAAGNLKSEAMIARSSAMLVDSYYRYATNHADQQFSTWQQETSTRRAATMGGQASIAATNGDVQGLDAFLSASDDEIRKQKETIKGYDPDALSADLAKNRGRNVANAVEQLALVGTNGSPNLSVAKAVFDKYKDQMDPQSVLAVEKYLAPKLLQDQAQKNANLILGGPGLMPGAGGGGPIDGPGHGRGSINASYTGPLDRAPVAGGPSPESLFTYLQSKGASRNEALMLTSGAASEGVFNPSAVHDNGIGYGLWGHNGDRLIAMQQFTGTKTPAWQQQADFALHELRQRPEAALVNAATTPVELANAEMHYEQPRAYTKQDPQAGENYNGRLNTIRRFTNLTASGDITEAQGSQPMLDKSDAINKAITISGDNAPLRAATISEINRRYSQYGAATATERQALSIDVPNKIAAAENGVDITDFPEARIRAVFPAPKAQAMIDQFAIARRVGTVMSGLQFASPDEINDAARDIESGQGHLSTMMKAHAHYEATGPGTIGADPNDDSNGAYFKLRAQAAKKLQDVITQRSKALSSDPAAYVQAEPSVQNAFAAAQKDPTKLGDYVNASLGVQTHLGVPEDQQHIFTRGQAMDVSEKLQNSGTDVRQQLTSLQQRFGPNYGKVFSDLVQLGKLPSSYQAVAVLPDHDDANLLARALQEAPGTGEDGKKIEGWNDRIIASTGNPQAPQQMKTAIASNTTMQSYLQSLKRQGLSAPQIDAIQKDISTLAQAKVYWKKMDPSSAAESAVDAFTKQFTFLPGGDARIPSNVADAVTRDGDTLVSNLDKAHVSVPQNVGGVGQPSADDFVSDVRSNHSWMNTQKGDGLILLDGAGRYVKDKDGNPYVVSFAKAGQIAAARPPAPRQDDALIGGP